MFFQTPDPPHAWWWSWVSPVVTLLAAFGGGWLGSFLSRRQKYWELRRDVALEVMRVLGELQQLLNSIFHKLRPGESHDFVRHIAATQGQEAAMNEADKINEQRMKLSDEYTMAMRKFWQVKGTVSLVFSEDTLKVMDDTQDALAYLVGLLGPTLDYAEAKLRMDHFFETRELLTQALRKELEL